MAKKRGTTMAFQGFKVLFTVDFRSLPRSRKWGEWPSSAAQKAAGSMTRGRGGRCEVVLFIEELKSEPKSLQTSRVVNI